MIRENAENPNGQGRNTDTASHRDRWSVVAMKFL
jgi:hypothetical protein